MLHECDRGEPLLGVDRVSHGRVSGCSDLGRETGPYDRFLSPSHALKKQAPKIRSERVMIVLSEREVGRESSCVKWTDPPFA